MEAPVEAPGSCDCEKLARGLPGLEDALERLAANVRPLAGTECLPLAGALGRVLARPVRNEGPLPRFDNSAMDGFALATRDLAGDGPWHLPVRARVAAGQMPAPLAPGTAARIFTGAPVPGGADTVVMQEATLTEADGIVLTARPAKGDHIRFAGEELAKGAEVLAAGTCIAARHIAALAAAGAGELQVRPKPRVALLVTGSEIGQAGARLKAAQIRDVNTPMMTAALDQPDLSLQVVAHLPDDRAALTARLEALSGDVDLIVTTGGLSVGEEDHLRPALQDLGAHLHFAGVAIKPGKPVALGHLGKAVWLGLPGNPLAAFVTWHLFGSAVIAALGGRDTAVSWEQIPLSEDIQRKPGRTEICPARIEIRGGIRTVSCLRTSSARVTHLPLADGLAVLPAELAQLSAGTPVAFRSFA